MVLMIAFTSSLVEAFRSAIYKNRAGPKLPNGSFQKIRGLLIQTKIVGLLF